MIRVSRHHPCPVCGKPDWCSVSEDGGVAVCMRTPSGKPSKNGGWVHRIGDGRPRAAPSAPPRRAKPPLFNAQALITAWTAETSLDAIYGHAESLGVSATALASLGACWSKGHEAWAFPMRDDTGTVIGIRLRHEQGRKWAVPGSREGLFFPMAEMEGNTVVVCEGPTDTAAGLTIGLTAVGRPSCLGAMDLFRAFARRRNVRRLVILGDNDPPRRRPDGSWWQPGLEGAMKLSQHCRIPFKLVVPPVKDLREWVRAGLTADQFQYIADQQRERRHGG